MVGYHSYMNFHMVFVQQNMLKYLDSGGYSTASVFKFSCAVSRTTDDFTAECGKICTYIVIMGQSSQFDVL